MFGFLPPRGDLRPRVSAGAPLTGTGSVMATRVVRSPGGGTAAAGATAGTGDSAAVAEALNSTAQAASSATRAR
jgi:hypothetical protein